MSLYHNGKKVGRGTLINSVLTGVLAVGNTSITFTDNRLTPNSFIEIYTNVYGVSPKEVDDSIAGSLTLTFDEQTEAITVKIIIREI